MKRLLLRGIAAAIALICATAHADDDMDKPVPPFQIYGNSYYVGLHGLGSVLITSPQGHILIDGALPESPKHIAASIGKLGFKLKDVKLILSTHDHIDHAGGIAELQRLSGAAVLASAKTARALRNGRPDKDDPQFADLTPFAKVAKVRVVRDGEVIKVGSLAVTAVYTPGHTPGGASYTWRSCEQDRCAQIVFADSFNAISSEGFKFTANKTYPEIVSDFEHTYAVFNALPCDAIISAHPEFSDMWDKLKSGKPHPLLGDGNDCKRYVTRSREKLNKRLADERAELH